MEIIKPIMDRRAFRAIDARPVPTDARERLIRAATLAPSCMNSQPWRFIAVEGENLAALKDCLEGGNYWAKTAPLIFAVVSDLAWDARLAGGRDYAFFDTGMACMNLMTQATAEGLYAHPIAGFKPDPAKVALGIPESHVLVTLIICGWPGDKAGLNERHQASEGAERSRKPLEQVSAMDRWDARLEPPAKG
jgi:nitroreductase